ncbi:MAG: glycosyltransferase family 2 protein [Anaerolineae bacterium]
MSQEQLPLVSILMPIRNEAPSIERSLGAVLAQDYPPDRLEVLVVDGMSDDGTREIVARLLAGQSNARLLDNPRRIVPTALNLGLAEARGEVIVRVDGHTLIAPDYVRRCVEALAETGADCVGGPMQAVGETSFGQAVALATGHPFGVGSSHFHYATEPRPVDSAYMGAWPRRAFAQVGFFDEEMIRDQDDEFNYRLRAAGGRIWLDPRIHSTYYARSTLRSLWRQYFRYGFWKVRVFQKVPGSAQLRHWAPPLFALAVVGGLVAALALPFLRPAYLGGLALYLGADLAVSVRIAARAGWQHLSRLLLTFPSLHLAYGLGFWAGMARFGLPWKGDKPPLSASGRGRGEGADSPLRIGEGRGEG